MSTATAVKLAPISIDAPSETHFLNDLIDGLSKKQKTLPCKYFYDQKGSELFDAICEVDEYYVTRTEWEILNTAKKQLADLIDSHAQVIEPGSGTGKKIQLLLSTLKKPKRYIPWDISTRFLDISAKVIQQRFPNLDIFPIHGDFSQIPDRTLLETLDKFTVEEGGKRVIFFPGSTIGNFDKHHAIALLKQFKTLAGKSGVLIVGFDLIKEKHVLEQAYDDKKGITAAFNKNLLHRANRELDANFDLANFEHSAVFNEQADRIEMHLRSKQKQVVDIGQHTVNFKEGETIHTENSHKYSLGSFKDLAKKAGLKVSHHWTDKKNYFALAYLEPANNKEG